jgi:excinuclease ABC subunit C
MMREVLTRRFKRLAADEAAAEVVSHPEAVIEPHASSQGEGREESRSRVMAPAPPPRTERGSDSIAFGVLPAARVCDMEDDDDSEPPPTDDGLESEEFPAKPDLVLIDGGAGQLGVARSVLEELCIVDVPLIGVAKGPDRDAGREHFHIPGRGHPLMLEPRDPVLYFIQRLRDEAHRFAIGTHRARRSKAIGINPLDEIAGIGPTRRRALLKHFGSAKAASRASVEDLKAVDGISRDMAQRIYDFFHERRE